jgi:superfamily I DNA and/or RNA helicase
MFTEKKYKHWAVEHGSSDITHTSNIRSLHQLITAYPVRRALLLGQRTPQADTSLRLSRSYSATYDDLLLRAKQAKDYFLLVGPPGTGKTSQALRFLVKEELQEPRPTAILLTAYTNRAVDEICGMLEGEQLDYLRLGNDSACDPKYRHRLLSTALAHISKLSEMRQHIIETPIIVGTTSTLQARQELFQLKHFSLCIVDEASQILEPNIIGLLAHERIDRFILIGDYKQLPAVASSDAQASEVTEPCLRAIGLTDCRQSLFERLIRWEQQGGRTQFIGTLNHQGRMHPTVAQFACEHFYQQEQLQTVPLPHQQETGALYNIHIKQPIDDLLTQRRVMYIDSNKEAVVTAQVLGRIYHYYGTAFDADKTIGVIVTYRNQISPIRQAIEKLHIEPLNHISIDTVERYQGSQRDVIVYAFGVDHRYQMDFLTANTFVENGQLIDRKLNVAMTRARRQLIMTGRKKVLNTSKLFRELIACYEVAWPNIEE